MNIKHYLSAMAALAMLAACSDYDPGMSENAVDLTDAEIATIEEYNANFIARYGTPAEGHTWGFGAKGSEDEMGTRLSDPKSNMWITYTKENGIGVVDFQINGDIKIPGFPVENYYLSSSYNKEPEGDPTKPAQNVRNVTTTHQNYEGWYHCRFPNENQDRWFENKADLIRYMQQHHFDEVIPLGDVAVCNDLSDAEVADVYKVFSEPWHGTNPTIDLKSYFVQQVWHGDAKYPYWDQTTRTEAAKSGVDYKTVEPSGYVIGGEKMDYLAAKGEGWTAGDNEHFYNFNASNYSNNQGGMMLIYDSNTQNFAYFNSLQLGSSEEKTIWNHFRLVELHGNYYVGFDFESVMKDGTDYDKDIPRDHIYNDWIVKIIPGEGTIEFPDHKWHRIMCEDLGSTDDYDFNDLVYDVYFTGTNNQYTAHIKVLASGGTLPIYIGTYDEVPEREAHQILQNGNAARISEQLYQPVNVAAGVTADPVEITFEMKDNQDNWLTGDAGTDPDNIPILVTSSDNSRQTAANKNTFVLPTTEKNVTPQKICIDGNLVDATKVKWMKERQQIEDSYQNFDMWVTEGPNSDYGFGKTNDWTKFNIKNTSKLY